jgi:hypothetical protein
VQHFLGKYVRRTWKIETGYGGIIINACRLRKSGPLERCVNEDVNIIRTFVILVVSYHSTGSKFC